jgi:hypothetical protein
MPSHMLLGLVVWWRWAEGLMDGWMLLDEWFFVMEDQIRRRR